MEEQMEVADILIKYNKFDMALEVLEEIKEEHKKELEVYYKISYIYEKKGLYDESLRVLKEIQNLYSDNGEIYFKIANIYEKKDELTSCFENLSLAIKYGYESEKVFFYKGLIYEKSYKTEEAVEEYNKSLKKNIIYMPSKYRLYAIYMKLNKFQDAEKILNNMLKYNSDNYDGYNLKFSFFIALGKKEDGLEILKKAETVFNNYEPLKLDFIRYYLIVKNFNKAEEIIDNVGEESPYYIDFMTKKAQILSLKGEREKAIELLKSKEVYDEENKTLLYLLAILDSQCGKYKEAMCEIDKLTMDKDYSNEYVKIGMILKGYCMKNINSAELVEEYFRGIYKILKIQSLSNPYDINTLLLRSIILIELREFEKSEKILDGLEKVDGKKYGPYVKNIKEMMNLKRENKEVNSYEIFDRNGYFG